LPSARDGGGGRIDYSGLRSTSRITGRGFDCDVGRHAASIVMIT